MSEMSRSTSWRMPASSTGAPSVPVQSRPGWTRCARQRLAPRRKRTGFNVVPKLPPQPWRISRSPTRLSIRTRWKPCGESAGDPAHRAPERGRHALVGVHLQNPVAGAGIDAGIATLAFQLPGAFQHAGGAAPAQRPAGDGAASVGAAVEHHHQLVGRRQALQAGGQARRLVPGHHQRAHLRIAVTPPPPRMRPRAAARQRAAPRPASGSASSSRAGEPGAMTAAARGPAGA